MASLIRMAAIISTTGTIAGTAAAITPEIPTITAAAIITAADKGREPANVPPSAVALRRDNPPCFAVRAACQPKLREAISSPPSPCGRWATFEITASYEGNYIELPTGKVDIHLGTADAVINFSPDMQVALQAQYDNISDNFGFSARYRWEYCPGNEIFVGIGQSALIDNRGFVARTTQATIR
jgi:hypothetical protein